MFAVVWDHCSYQRAKGNNAYQVIITTATDGAPNLQELPANNFLQEAV